MGIDGWACLAGALLLLTVPLQWLAAALTAAAVHELCHVLAIRLTGGKIHGFHIGLRGAVLDTSPMGDRQEFFCALAGPIGSFLLTFLFRRFPRLALCGFVQGFFNLLPLWPMDGGRILRALLRKKPCKRCQIRVQ